MKITKRDLLFFIIGLVTMFIVESIFDWKGTKDAYMKGYDEGSQILKR